VRNYLAVALILLVAGMARAQDGVIAGMVRDASTRAPLAGAKVSVEGSGVERSVVSDLKGEFRFEDLPAGTYSVRCSMEGYLTQSTPAARGQAGRPAAQTLVELVAVSTIEGTVSDEDGKPMAGVSLYAAGNLRDTTGSDGHFRIENLTPAIYRIDLRIPLEIRKQTLKRNTETGETFGYPNTEYYPGTADVQAAVRVPISGGLRLHGFDIRLRRVLLVDLSGRVIESAGGGPIAAAHVELAANFQVMADESFAARPVDETGNFRFEAIQPGSYSLLVFRGNAETDLPYVHAVDVGRTGTADLTVRVPPVQKLEGTVLTASDDVEWTGKLTISLMPLQRGARSRRWDVTAEDFALDGLPPGRYSFLVQSAAEMKGSKRKLVVSGFHLGTQDLVTSPAVVSEGGNPPVEIRLSGETGRIVVRAKAADGTPQPDMVFVTRSMMSSIFWLDVNGGVTVDDLAPGSYEVSLPTGIKTQVEVKAGETAVVELHSPAH
jgi:hypothetical protein